MAAALFSNDDTFARGATRRPRHTFWGVTMSGSAAREQPTEMNDSGGVLVDTGATETNFSGLIRVNTNDIEDLILQESNRRIPGAMPESKEHGPTRPEPSHCGRERQPPRRDIR